MKKFIIIIALGITTFTVKAKEGVASYYHDSLDGNLTANGEIYRKDKISAAHKTLPFGTMLLVTNKRNNKSVIVKINDRGPFIKGRDIDLSRKAAEEIDMIERGVIKVEYEILPESFKIFWDNWRILKTNIIWK